SVIKCPQCRIGDPLTGLLVHYGKDMLQRLTQSFSVAPAGEGFGYPVHKVRSSLNIGRHHSIPNAVESDANPFPLLPFPEFTCLSCSPRLVQAFCEQARKRATKEKDDRWRKVRNNEGICGGYKTVTGYQAA